MTYKKMARKKMQHQLGTVTERRLVEQARCVTRQDLMANITDGSEVCRES